MKRALISLAVIVTLAIVFSVAITRDSDRVVPTGTGAVNLPTGTFEAFPLPDYARKHLSDDYKSYFVEVEPGVKIHVLEVGSGFPVLLQHGNPTSGFLYRKVVSHLPTDRLRIIMPTLVGLGFSTKVRAREHTLNNHIRWMHEVFEQLELNEVVYAGQDWGGPIAMGAFARSPERLEGMVVMNTFFNAVTEEGALSPGHGMAARPVLGELVFEVLISIFKNLPRNQGDPDSLPPEILQLYADPVVQSGNKKAVLAMMRMVPNGPDHPTTQQMKVIEQYVKSLEIPVEIVWGNKDPILAKELPAMKQNFPNARVTETEAGHFLQEEVPEEIAAALIRVANQIISRSDRS